MCRCAHRGFGMRGRSGDTFRAATCAESTRHWGAPDLVAFNMRVARMQCSIWLPHSAFLLPKAYPCLFPLRLQSSRRHRRGVICAMFSCVLIKGLMLSVVSAMRDGFERQCAVEAWACWWARRPSAAPIATHPMPLLGHGRGRQAPEGFVPHAKPRPGLPGASLEPTAHAEGSPSPSGAGEAGRVGSGRGRCSQSTLGGNVGCRRRCSCSWAQRCYVKREAGEDIGICGVSMSLLAVVAACIVVMLIVVVLFLRIVLLEFDAIRDAHVQTALLRRGVDHPAGSGDSGHQEQVPTPPLLFKAGRTSTPR